MISYEQQNGQTRCEPQPHAHLPAVAIADGPLLDGAPCSSELEEHLAGQSGEGQASEGLSLHGDSSSKGDW